MENENGNDIRQRPGSSVIVTMDHVTGDINLNCNARHLDEAMNMLQTALRHVEMQWRVEQMRKQAAAALDQQAVAGMMSKIRH